ncbi:unnamed protein product [Cylindrotheca closterium]|uniref:VOC domain-containing protein n=1 Tax=Cylindrotheca closterium TaxID=2856 RepID=A0AAD2GDH6_9STRA|nr:unnamed protein product [Cylindrotheca closterium]
MILDAVGIVCGDLKQSTKFYGLLGLEFQSAGGPEHLEATTPTGLRLMLDSEDLMKKINPDFVKPTGSGMTLCFKQESAAEVNKVYDSVIKSGYVGTKAPYDAFWGQRYASIKDPDGNPIDLFADLN